MQAKLRYSPDFRALLRVVNMLSDAAFGSVSQRRVGIASGWALWVPT